MTFVVFFLFLVVVSHKQPPRLRCFLFPCLVICLLANQQKQANRNILATTAAAAFFAVFVALLFFPQCKVSAFQFACFTDLLVRWTADRRLLLDYDYSREETLTEFHSATTVTTFLCRLRQTNDKRAESIRLLTKTCKRLIVVNNLIVVHPLYLKLF